MTQTLTPDPPQVATRIAGAPMFALVILIGLGDYLLYHVLPGVALPVFLASIAACAHAICFRDVPPTRALKAWGILILALVPAVDFVQMISVIFALVGLLAFVGILSGGAGRAALRFPILGASCIITDARAALHQPKPTLTAHFAASLRDWIVPGGLGLIFAALMITANPVIDQWIAGLFTGLTLPVPDPFQIVLLVLLVPLIWPFLRLQRMRRALCKPAPEAKPLGQVWFLSSRSVTRALVLSNVIFAVQTFSDLTILWRGAALPEGMTYAQYAHRGAYPLLIAALLAGGFGLLTQPFLGGRPILRALLLIWVTQTAFLMASSMLRLDLYIDTYGLTRLRFLALIWMAVIGGGLVLMLWQILCDFGPGWLMLRAVGLAVIAIYCVSLTNVDGLIARQNLKNTPFTDQAHARDSYYLCSLEEGAMPAIAEYEARTGQQFCGRSYGTPKTATPVDWREWGYRNARLRHKLTQMKGATQ